MRCLHPRTVGFKDDGKTISWSQTSYSKEFATFQLPCGKCIECRLEYARNWAVRCVHEAKMYEDNSFITLTYDDQHLKSSKLDYSHFQTFIRDLRSQRYQELLNKIYPNIERETQRKLWNQLTKERKKELYEPIQTGYFVTGEYGDTFKRPHWHAIVFNWRPSDCIYKYSNERGDKVYKSDQLDSLWNQGITEVGSVTFESAGYCARYAAKKLVHGNDGSHQFNPISKKSSRHAIGKKFLEKYWRDIFNYGTVVLDNGQKTTIPRYYEKWLLKHHPLEWERYVSQIKLFKSYEALKKADKEKQAYLKNSAERFALGKSIPITKSAIQKVIIEEKFKRLQKHLKGDI